MKKGCMLGLLVLCTGFTFAADPTAAGNVQKFGPLTGDEVMKAHLKGAKVTANDAANSHGVKATAVKVTSEKLSPTAANGQRGNWFGLRSGQCADALYWTGDPDGVNGLTNERGNFGIESWCIDDAKLDSATTVAALHWQGLVSAAYGDSTIDILVLPDDGGVPNGDDGTALYAASDTTGCRNDQGYTLFGYPVIEYSFYFPGGLSVPAGTTWYNGRPVSGSGSGRSFWATANFGSPTGYAGMWRSPFFGYYSWSDASSQLGGETDFSFCITESAGGGAGTCCLDGDCFESDKDSCTGRGGTYNGDGSVCCAIACSGRAAACCFADGTCENLKPAACQEAGGERQGGDEGILCGPGVCPLPDFCADSLFNQFGYDGVNGLDSQDSGDIGWIDAWCADDAVFTSSVDITGAVWQTVETAASVTQADYQLYYTAVSGGPGKLIDEGDNVAVDARLTDGSQLFGRTVWVYKITTNTDRATPGTFYVALRPRIEEFSQSFWLTASDDGIPGYFKSKFFGIPNWVNASSQLGTDSGFSFCVLGTVAEVSYGACCLEDESVCALMTADECDRAGGTYYGDDSQCFPSPCANEPGACCYDDGSCQVTKPADCTGNFVGGGTECGAGVCPLPDFCADALYSQFGYDGRNGLANQDTSSLNWVVAWTVDDAVISGPSIATGIVVQNVTRGNPTVDAEDALLTYTAGTGGPGSAIVDLADTTSFVRMTDGSNIFSGTIWVSKVDIPATNLTSGNYYVGARENINEYQQSFLLTVAGGGGADGYFQGALFGYPNWTDATNLVGSPAEFSFCLLGQVSEVPFGACCYGNDTYCTIVTQDECSAMDGRYVGDDAGCAPSPCKNAPGACCFLDPFGCTDGMSEGDCNGKGGTFQGGDTSCANLICPLPDWCGSSYYSQIDHTDYGLMNNQDHAYFGFDYQVADDFSASGPVDVTGLVWADAAYNFGGADPENPPAVDWAVYYTAGSGPTKTIASENVVTTYERFASGELYFNFYPIYYTRVFFSSPVRVVSGDYYINGRVRVDSYPNGYWYSYAITSASGSGGSAYYNYNGGAWFSLGWDSAFCVLGAKSDVAFGACCTDNDSTCSLLTAKECKANGGNYAGDDQTCFPNPCKNAPGACCLESGECLFVSPSDCDKNAGNFQGGDVECNQAHCPIPDPCDGDHGDVLYNNSAPDGVNGLWSADGSNIGWIVAYCADDVEFSADTTIGSLHYYDLHQDGAVDGTGDYQILGEADCLPDDGNVLADVNDVAFQTLDAGYTLFGYKVWQNNVDVNMAIPAGHYYIAMRLNNATFSPSYWATAPLSDCGGSFKSASFGYPNWVNANTQLGRESDFALCVTGSADPCHGVMLGDSDGSGHVDFNDIDCFVAAMIADDGSVWADCGTLYPPGAFVCANDTDHSGHVDFNDIDSFVDCLVNDFQPCP